MLITCTPYYELLRTIYLIFENLHLLHTRNEGNKTTGTLLKISLPKIYYVSINNSTQYLND